MPRLVNRVPSYRKHRASGQALVTLNGQDHYLGPFGTKVSRAEYDRLIAEWLTRGKQPAQAAAELTVMELIDAFLNHAEVYYRGADGKPASEYGNLCDALRPMKRLYGVTAALDFGPLALRGVRDEMVKLRWCRSHVNRQVNRVRHVFKWAAGRELLPASVHQALHAVEGLRAGRSGARESEPVRPVPEEHVYAIKDHVSRQVWALIELQLLTGMRPGEACSMRGCDLDTGGKLWVYKPARHKTQHHGHERLIYLGPQARKVVEHFLKPDPQACLFSPTDAEAERRAAMAAARRTPRYCGNGAGTHRRSRPRKAPGQRYSVEAYCKAVHAACSVAFPPPPELARQRVPANGRKRNATRWETVAEWRARLGDDRLAALRRWREEHRWHPHQLRHTAATRLRREHGLEAAQVILGHKTLTVTQVYAEKNVAAAQRVMTEVG
jgi:integrase